MYTLYHELIYLGIDSSTLDDLIFKCSLDKKEGKTNQIGKKVGINRSKSLSSSNTSANLELVINDGHMSHGINLYESPQLNFKKFSPFTEDKKNSQMSPLVGIYKLEEEEKSSSNKEQFELNVVKCKMGDYTPVVPSDQKLIK